MADANTNNYDLIVEQSKGLLRIGWHGLLHYRDILFLLVRRYFLAQYKQTILGPLWFIIQSLQRTVVFDIIIWLVAKNPVVGVPAMLFYFQSGESCSQKDFSI